jgi:hypothetical protein
MLNLVMNAGHKVAVLGLVGMTVSGGYAVVSGKYDVLVQNQVPAVRLLEMKMAASAMRLFYVDL